MINLNDLCVQSIGSSTTYQPVACNPANPDVLYLKDAAAHGSDGTPANCDLLTDVLADSDNVERINDYLGSSSTGFDVGNVLVGRYLIDNGIQLPDGFHVGIEGGSDAISIQNSNLGPGTAQGIPLAAQTDDDCNSTNCGLWVQTNGYAWDQLQWDHPHLGEMYYLNNFQRALRASQNVAGDWSNNPPNDVGVDWVLSFPDKYAYLDYIPMKECDSTETSTDKAWCLLAETRYGNGPYGNPEIWTPYSGEGVGTLDLCLKDNKTSVYDTEEQEASSNVSVSPGSRTKLDICNELTVLTLAAEGQDIKPSVIQTQDERLVVRFTNLDAVRGWGKIDLDWNQYPGDAVSGLIFTTRATSSPTDQNGSLTDLQKDVDIDDLN
jgi:hypothetical protein